jgi:hypothetical protein
MAMITIGPVFIPSVNAMPVLLIMALGAVHISRTADTDMLFDSQLAVTICAVRYTGVD